ncbi:PPC domain-containing protein [Benzoatithermus flavus]|uniref:PPC domain-containing protein n=1 Tax=Benzoatithermus flavus TaxID=3108223 RepID=A0ABU8XUD7_9PROT
MPEFRISVGQTASSDINPAGDVDTYGIRLTAGQAYSFDVDGDGLDPTLTIRDPFGTAVAFDDDGGGGFDSHLDFLATSSGTYTLVVAGFANDTGHYDLVTAIA